MKVLEVLALAYIHLFPVLLCFPPATRLMVLVIFCVP